MHPFPWADEQFLQFSGLGFVTLVDLLCADSFVFICVYFVFFCRLHLCYIIVTRWGGSDEIEG